MIALTQEFWQVSVPLMSTGLLATLATVTTIVVTVNGHSKRIDDLRADVTKRLEKIDETLKEIRDLLQSHDSRITRLEERTSLLRR
ncbi:MAG: hypothetical protein ACR2NN_06480 [Bryobacteraceae bacterium]